MGKAAKDPDGVIQPIKSQKVGYPAHQQAEQKGLAYGHTLNQPKKGEEGYPGYRKQDGKKKWPC